VLQTLVLKKGAKSGSLALAQPRRQCVTDAGVEKREQNSAPWRRRSHCDSVLQTLVLKKGANSAPWRQRSQGDSVLQTLVLKKGSKIRLPGAGAVIATACYRRWC